MNLHCIQIWGCPCLVCNLRIISIYTLGAVCRIRDGERKFASFSDHSFHIKPDKYEFIYESWLNNKPFTNF